MKSPEPDMAKVRAAVAAIEARRRANAPVSLAPPTPPPLPPLPARDTAIRKRLTSHGDPCIGFNYYHFHNRT
jgi:hypothetical protein